MQIRGHLVQIIEGTIVPVEVRVEGGIIQSIRPLDNEKGAAAASPTGAAAASGGGGTTGSPTGAAAASGTGGPHPGPSASAGPYLLPGFVDSHVHIESSLLIPSEFARMAVVHGTVATVSDPHEIAN